MRIHDTAAGIGSMSFVTAPKPSRYSISDPASGLSVGVSAAMAKRQGHDDGQSQYAGILRGACALAVKATLIGLAIALNCL